MKGIGKHFRKYGFDFHLVERFDSSNGSVAIYSQGYGKDIILAYEVGVIRMQDETQLFGKKFEACEMWPSASQWGTYGWTCNTIEDARKRFNDLVSERAPKKAKKGK